MDRLMATILVCDDIPAIRRMARRFLENAGHEVEEADDGQAAVDHVRAKPVDVILLDMVMRTLDGVETIKALADAGSNARVVAMTGGDQEMIDEACKHGAVGAVRKPLHSSTLIDAVNAALKANPTPS